MPNKPAVPYNTKAIVNNLKLVFRTRDINKLNGTAYHFISQHMGFIAHYDINGFKSVYEDVQSFAQTLETSEYSKDLDYNLKWATKRETGTGYYGDAAYNKSIAETIRGIIEAARTFQNRAGDEEGLRGGWEDELSPLFSSKTKKTRKAKVVKERGRSHFPPAMFSPR
jgi:hypothetical protein